MAADPYTTLGVQSAATDAEVRAAYRRLVQLHHPDHNGGSAESTRRFEEVQDAYAEVKRRRAGGAAGRPTPPRPQPPRRPPPPPPPRPAPTPRTAPARGDPAIESRLADLEREVRRERERVRQAARAAAREAAAAARPGRPTDEELGYVTTEDSLAKILSDARAQAAERLAEIREPVSRKVADLLDDVATRLGGSEPPREPE